MTTTASTTLSNLISDADLQPYSDAYAVNSKGVVVVDSGTYQTGALQAVVWQNGSLTTLAGYDGATHLTRKWMSPLANRSSPLWRTSARRSYLPRRSGQR